MRQNRKNKMKTRIDHRSTNSARGRPVFANYHMFRIYLDVLESGRANRFASRDDTRENVRDICHTVSRLRLFRVHIFAGKKKKKKKKKEKEHATRACSWQIARNLVEKIFITFHLSLCSTVN